jgi:hypothetical protein
MAVRDPPSVEGGPVVVEFRAPEPKQSWSKPKIKREPERQMANPELLTAREFVEKYRREVKTASWDPKVLRKCGRGAEQILMTLGAHQHKESVPLREQARRRQLHLDQAELGSVRMPEKKSKKRAEFFDKRSSNDQNGL